MAHRNTLSLPAWPVVVDVVEPDPGESAARGLGPVLPPPTDPTIFNERGDVLLLPSEPEDLLLEARSRGASVTPPTPIRLLLSPKWPKMDEMEVKGAAAPTVPETITSWPKATRADPTICAWDLEIASSRVRLRGLDTTDVDAALEPWFPLVEEDTLDTVRARADDGDEASWSDPSPHDPLSSSPPFIILLLLWLSRCPVNPLLVVILRFQNFPSSFDSTLVEVVGCRNRHLHNFILLLFELSFYSFPLLSFRWTHLTIKRDTRYK